MAVLGTIQSSEMTILKVAESLTVDDIVANPIWKFENHDEVGETCVRPVEVMPVPNLAGMLVGTQVILANGTRRWAVIGNIYVENRRLTEHFLTLSVEQNGGWFHLARYFDHDHSVRGPEALSRFLGLQVGDVFPIAFDIHSYSRGDPAALAGIVSREPRERLSRQEIIALSVSSSR